MVVDYRFPHVVSVEDLRSSRFQATIKEYLLTCKLDFKAKTSIESYSIRLRLFNQFLIANNLPCSIEEINTFAVRSFIGYLTDKKLSPVTILAYYRHLHSFFRWCEREGMIKASPMFNMNPPKTPKTIIKAFTREDIRKLLALCEGDKYTSIRNKALIYMFVDTGLRLSEMAGVQMKDINIEAGIVKIMGKGSKERMLGLGINSRKALFKYLRYRNTTLLELWQTEEKRPLAAPGIQQIIQRLCIHARIDDARGSPHTLRHTFAMMQLENGASIYDLKVALGHSDIKTTQRYLNSYTSETVIEALRKSSPMDHL